MLVFGPLFCDIGLSLFLVIVQPLSIPFSFKYSTSLQFVGVSLRAISLLQDFCNCCVSSLIGTTCFHD
ncbi:hypothetical protein EUGRSUZ_J00921 [Eucalyptus grandis]|uniref:Uncharacterized protein n=2 Tax=Eucalyptus grandis TaxID=71139 RepID=A0ACC3J4Y1_EUCGR|nr:hypothetical protein EUGRSUZ_J00921 [Eucalyptus grandis]